MNDLTSIQVNKKDIKNILIALLLVVLTALPFLLFRNWITFKLASAVAVVGYETQNKAAVDLWEYLYTTSGYQSHLEANGLPRRVPVDVLFEEVSRRNIEYPIYALSLLEERYEVDLEIEVSTIPLNTLPETIEIKKEGEPGALLGKRESLLFRSNGAVNPIILADEFYGERNGISEIVYTGNVSENEAKDLALRTIAAALEEPYSVNNINFSQEILRGEEVNIEIGEATVIKSPCMEVKSIPLFYNIQSEEYSINFDPTIFKGNCIGETGAVASISSCTDCTFERVDKTHGLPAYYAPSVVQIDWNGTTGLFSADAVNDLYAMLEASLEAGHSIVITSAYRSYETQQNTFNYWVSTELAGGATSEAEAIARANQYSAMPGFSEHQLGTTVDLNASQCAAFEGFCIYNERAWQWLADNAVSYGFVLSYPEGKESITGYIYEPWHFRWLGKDLAAQFEAQDSTLNIWLDTIE